MGHHHTNFLLWLLLKKIRYSQSRKQRFRHCDRFSYPVRACGAMHTYNVLPRAWELWGATCANILCFSYQKIQLWCVPPCSVSVFSDIVCLSKWCEGVPREQRGGAVLAGYGPWWQSASSPSCVALVLPKAQVLYRASLSLNRKSSSSWPRGC